MTTKEQERKALDKIKEIIAGLGKDSYIGAAIDPRVLALAESNIDNDFLITNTSKIEAAEEAIRRAEAAANEAKQEKRAAKERTEAAERKAAEYKEKYEALYKANEELKRDIAGTEVNVTFQENRAEAAEAEIIALKAKLYDYMTK